MKIWKYQEKKIIKNIELIKKSWDEYTTQFYGVLSIAYNFTYFI